MTNKYPVSKIVKYKLEQETVNLRQAGFSYQKIADELNELDAIPSDDLINAEVVRRFLDSLPGFNREMVKRDEKRLLAVVDNNIDIISEVSSLYQRSKKLLDDLECYAETNRFLINPQSFKAVASEMRAMLKLMIEIQREINDYESTKKFMEIVMETVSDECPSAIPAIVQKLKMTKETEWLGQSMSRRR